MRFLRDEDRPDHLTMTRHDLSDIDIDSVDEFVSLLEALVEKADHAGVDVRGAWEVETSGSVIHWEVEIWELDRSSED